MHCYLCAFVWNVKNAFQFAKIILISGFLLRYLNYFANFFKSVLVLRNNNFLYFRVPYSLFFTYWHLFIFPLFLVRLFAITCTCTEISIAIPYLFSLMVAWYMIFYYFTVNISVLSYLKWVFCMQHIVWSCVCVCVH